MILIGLLLIFSIGGDCRGATTAELIQGLNAIVTTPITKEILQDTESHSRFLRVNAATQQSAIVLCSDDSSDSKGMQLLNIWSTIYSTTDKNQLNQAIIGMRQALPKNSEESQFVVKDADKLQLIKVVARAKLNIDRLMIMTTSNRRK